MKAQKQQKPELNNAEIIRLTVVFEMKRGEVPGIIEKLKNSKQIKYLYHWVNQEWEWKQNGNK